MRRSSTARAATTAPPWAVGAEEALQRLATKADGLPEDEARRRLADAGPAPRLRRASALGIFLRQFKSPLVLILVFAAAVSILTRDWVDAAIVLLIVLASAVLSFQQEYRAGRAVERLLARIAPSASVLRGGNQTALLVCQLRRTPFLWRVCY